MDNNGHTHVPPRTAVWPAGFCSSPWIKDVPAKLKACQITLNLNKSKGCQATLNRLLFYHDIWNAGAAPGSFYMPKEAFMSGDHSKPCVMYSEFACSQHGALSDGTEKNCQHAGWDVFESMMTKDDTFLTPSVLALRFGFDCFSGTGKGYSTR